MRSALCAGTCTLRAIFRPLNPSRGYVGVGKLRKIVILDDILGDTRWVATERIGCVALRRYPIVLSAVSGAL